MDRVFTACRNGDLENLKKYFDTGFVDVDSEDDSSMTPLMHACQEGKLPVVKYLLEQQNANVEAEDDQRMTPLMYASSGGHLNVVKYLLEEQDIASVDIEHSDRKNGGALAHACIHGHLPIVKYLVEERKANKGWPHDFIAVVPATQAMKHGHVSIMKYLFEQMATDPDCKCHIRVPDNCLESACSQGNLAAVKYLLAGPVSESRGKFPRSAAEITAHNACNMNQLAILQYILEEWLKDKLPSQNMLFRMVRGACFYNQLSIVKYLFPFFERNNIQLSEKRNQELLFGACKKDSLCVVEYLLEERKLDVEMKGDNSRTCLMEACEFHSLRSVKYLIEKRNANVNATDDNGMTALMHACRADCFPIVRYLVEERNVNIEYIDYSGHNCLVHAFQTRGDLVVPYLTYDCQMDFPGISLSIDPTHSEETEDFVEAHCNDPVELKRDRFQCIRDMRQFIQRRELQEDWYFERDNTFHQLIPLRITHNYQFIENNNPNTLSDLKVYFGEVDNSNAESRTVVYARKEILSKSCTFMENLLTGEMNDVKDDPDDPGMQMVELNQELLGDCPRDLLKQLMIFLSWSKDGESIQHYVTKSSADDYRSYPFDHLATALKYCRTINALGIEMDLSEWTHRIMEMVRAYNIQWIEQVEEGIPLSVLEICDICRFDISMFDLWTEVLGEKNEDLYFFMLVNSAPLSSSSPTSVASKCVAFLIGMGKDPDYKKALSNDNITVTVLRTTGYDIYRRKLSIEVDEAKKFVKRKRQRTE